MEERALLDALIQMKRMGNLLNEVWDISRQLAEALDRDDQVTVRMLIDIREEPINKLRMADQAFQNQRDALLYPADAQRLVALLNGAAAETEKERALADQVNVNARLLKQVVELDKALSRKLAREKSIYEKKRNIDPS